jgi:hypothetical protein
VEVAQFTFVLFLSVWQWITVRFSVSTVTLQKHLSAGAIWYEEGTGKPSRNRFFERGLYGWFLRYITPPVEFRRFCSGNWNVAMDRQTLRRKRSSPVLEYCSRVRQERLRKATLRYRLSWRTFRNISSRTGMLVPSQVAGHVYPFVSTRGPQGYKWRRFNETPWQFMRNENVFDVPLRTCSIATQLFPSTD